MEAHAAPEVLRAGGRTADVLRLLTAAGALLSAIVHVQQYLAGYSEISVIGPLFLLNTAAGVILCAAVLVWRHWLPVLLAAGFGIVTAAAYWYSVLFGLFGFQETIVSGVAVMLAELGEYVAIVCGIAAAVMLRRTPRRSPEQTPVP